MTAPEFVTINGHQVPADQVDRFLDGHTGQPITDEQWDEQKARLQADNSYLVPEEFR